MAKEPKQEPEGQGNGLSADVVMVGDGGGMMLDVGGDDDNDNWDLPKQTTPPSPPPKQAVAEQQDEQQDDEQDAYADERLAYDPEGDEGPAQARETSRRKRRNQARREALSARDHEIETLKHQLTVVGGVVQRLSQGQIGLAVSNIDSQISSLQQALGLADQEIASAITEQNGEKYREVQKLRDDIVARLYSARQFRQRYEGAAAQPQYQPPAPQQQPQVDPRVAAAIERRFEVFQDRHPWFDPEGADADTNIVRAIDAELVTEGYLRHTPAFWNALERRMDDYGLNERRGNRDEEDDAPPPARRAALPPSRRSGPPTGSGRSVPSTRRATPELDSMKLAILREEGLDGNNLPEADKKRRDRYIKAWRDGEKSLRNGGLR